MRDPQAEYERKQEELAARRDAERNRAGKLAVEVLKTQAGAELFEYFAKRFHLVGRCFLTTDARGAADPIAAASRDGEKSLLWELVKLAKRADPDFVVPIPTPE